MNIVTRYNFLLSGTPELRPDILPVDGRNRCMILCSWQTQFYSPAELFTSHTAVIEQAHAASMGLSKFAVATPLRQDVLIGRMPNRNEQSTAEPNKYWQSFHACFA